MKKVKYIALALVLCLGLIGGAYAVWTDTMSAEATVVTGCLEHSWWIAGHFPNEATYEDEGHWHYGKVVPHTWSDWYAGDPLVIEMHNMYPGAEVVFYPRIYNTCTVPSKIVNASITRKSGSATLFDNLQGQVAMVHYDANNDSVGIVVWHTPWYSLGDLEAHLNTRFADYFSSTALNPGDYLSFDEESLHFRVDPGAGNETQSKSVVLEIKFEFEQWMP